jgi:hypothetical protein
MHSPARLSSLCSWKPVTRRPSRHSSASQTASSLYLSNGGGFVGAGSHDAVAEANRRWLESGLTYLPKLPAISDPSLPTNGMTQFVAVTPEGHRGATAPEADLGNGRHSLSPFFYAAQEVITQIRLTQG